MSDDKFSVYQFFGDQGYEKVRENVSATEAMEAVRHYTDNVTAKMGLTTRVIITDDGDLTCFEWKYGEGVVFPPRPEKEESK